MGRICEVGGFLARRESEGVMDGESAVVDKAQ